MINLAKYSLLIYLLLKPFTVLLVWAIKQLKGFNLRLATVYVSLFVVSFILLNQRQVLFWVLIVLANLSVGLLSDLRYISNEKYGRNL